MPFFLGNSHQWNFGWGSYGSFVWPWIVIPIALWSIFFTGIALWHAAKRGEKGWFVFFLIVHTAGILEMVYLVFVVQLFSTAWQSPALKKRIAKKKSV